MQLHLQETLVLREVRQHSQLQLRVIGRQNQSTCDAVEKNDVSTLGTNCVDTLSHIAPLIMF